MHLSYGLLKQVPDRQAVAGLLSKAPFRPLLITGMVGGSTKTVITDMDGGRLTIRDRTSDALAQ